MKTKIIGCLLAATMVLGACSKEQPQPSSATTPTTLKYKISPNKLTELRDLHLAIKSGQNMRITEETFTQEEFYLYAEAIINSMLTDFSSEPEQMAERNLEVPFEGESYTLTALLAYLESLENAIESDLAGVVFEFASQNSPFVHLIDIDWENGGAIHYIAGLNSTLNSSSPLINMTFTLNGTCSNLALNGPMQNLMLGHWNTNPAEPLNYRPNVLFNAAWNPNWTFNYIPAYTFTEITTRTIDYAREDQRHLYSRANGGIDWFWHRVVQGANSPPPCLPDNVGGSSMPYYALMAAQRAWAYNPRQYQFHDQDGLVLIGFSIEPKSELSSILTPGSSSDQREYWHRITYSYGRQIIIGEPPLGNE